MIYGYCITKSFWYLQDFDNQHAYWTTSPKDKLVFTTELEADFVADGIQLLTRKFCTVSRLSDLDGLASTCDIWAVRADIKTSSYLFTRRGW
jgi:hypothetical protein